jgi:TRAP-type mannitol/chloroaromatic compound transport system permease small subunit
MNALVRTLEAGSRSIGRLAAWLIVPLAISMVWEVVSRYVFSRPTVWAYELAYMQTGGLFLLGIAYVAQVDDHVRVDLAYRSFSPRGKALVDLLGQLLVAPLVLWLCFGLWGYFEDAWHSGETSGESIWNPVVWPVRITYWLGFALFAAQVAANILKAIHTIATGKIYNTGD